MSKGFTSTYRIAFLAFLVLGTFVGLEVRLVWLHVIDREEFLKSVDEARRQLIVENARRGDILDAAGGLLATSRSVIVLGVDPQSVRPEDRSKWPQLSELIGVPLADIERLFTTKTRPAAETAVKVPPSAVVSVKIPGSDAPTQAPTVPAIVVEDTKDDTELDEPDPSGNRPIRWAKLSEEITEATYAQVSKLGIKGVYGTRVYRRSYPHKEMAAHVVGYVDKEEHPMAGIEHYADFYLRGENGWLESEKDGKSHELAQFRTREVPPSDGYSVTLSIDATIQSMVEEQLAAIATKYDPEKATIIVSDPQTGFILALANYPSFDLNAYNKLSKEEQRRMRNVAVADEYEPGSVFKIVAASAALNEHVVTPRSEFDCTLEKVEYNGITRSLPREDASDHFTHPLSVSEIIAHSSNKGAAQLAMRLGDQKFYEYARAFGFGQRTGFPVGGETPGNLKNPSKWDSLTITRMPMGQSVTANALQMQQAMGVIASGGLLLKPQIIKEIRDAKGDLVYKFNRVVVRRVISEDTAKTVARMLTGVVSPEGTAPNAAIPGFECAGKTGTAQKLLPVELASGASVLRYSEKHHVASFVGFFPASHPQISIAVIIDDADAHCPGGVAYGAKVAAPIFKQLGEKLIPYRDIRPAIDNSNLPSFALGGASR
jgi:cell division protein FtsI/penicillin-binding protein 2